MANFASKDMFDYMESKRLELPNLAYELSNFIVPEERGSGWRHIDGPDISPMDDYLQKSFELAQANPISPHFALNFAGHGTNSYSINLRMILGPVLVVAQYGWGGVYMDHDVQREKWNDGIDALEDFFNELDTTIDIFEPPAPRDLEVLIRFSDFRSSEAFVDTGEGKIIQLGLARRGKLRKLLDDVLEYEQPSWGLG